MVTSSVNIFIAVCVRSLTSKVCFFVGDVHSILNEFFFRTNVIHTVPVLCLSMHLAALFI